MAGHLDWLGAAVTVGVVAAIGWTIYAAPKIREGWDEAFGDIPALPEEATAARQKLAGGGGAAPHSSRTQHKDGLKRTARKCSSR